MSDSVHSHEDPVPDDPKADSERERLALRRTIGSIVRQVRMARCWTQEDVGERLGVTPEFYSRIERGDAAPGLELFRKMTFLFQVSGDVLLGLKPFEACEIEPAEDTPFFRKLVRRVRTAKPRTHRVVKKILTAIEEKRKQGG